mgnify:CR=1 FL=1
MKPGDLVKFNKTGVIATIVKISTGILGDYAILYVADDSLDNTPSSNGITPMSLKMLQRTAGVISESR